MLEKRAENLKTMKNANVFVDVDLTLVDSNGKLVSGAREGLEKLRDAGCHLFLWSTCGADYCRKVAAIHHLTDFFEGFSAKPDIIIDDMPATCTGAFAYAVGEQSWPDVVGQIIDKHID